MLKVKVYAQVAHFALTSFVLALLSILLISGSAKAQQCSDILQRGIYDISTTSSETSLSESYLRWLSRQEVRTEQEARDFSLNIGVVLPTEIPLPVELGIGSSSSSARTYGQALSEYFRTNSERRSIFNQQFLNINSNVVAAWRDCVRNRKGLVCWADQTRNPNEVYLNIEFRPIASPVPTLIIRSITTSPNVGARENVIGEELSTNVFPVIFARTGSRRNDAINFTIRTNNANYACTAEVAGISEVPPRPLPNVRIFIRATDFDQGVRVLKARDITSLYEANGDVVMRVPHRTFQPSGCTLVYRANSNRTGRYELYVTYASLQSRPMKIFANGEVVNHSGLDAATGGDAYSFQRKISQGNVRLNAGSNTITLECLMLQAMPHISSLELVPID